MNVRFVDVEIERLYRSGKSKKYRQIERDEKLRGKLATVIGILYDVPDCESLKYISKLHYEKLKHEYSGKSSVRLSNSYIGRLIFTEEDGGISINLLEIDDTHYGNK